MESKAGLYVRAYLLLSGEARIVKQIDLLSPGLYQTGHGYYTNQISESTFAYLSSFVKEIDRCSVNGLTPDRPFYERKKRAELGNRLSNVLFYRQRNFLSVGAQAAALGDYLIDSLSYSRLVSLLESSRHVFKRLQYIIVHRLISRKLDSHYNHNQLYRRLSSHQVEQLLKWRNTCTEWPSD